MSTRGVARKLLSSDALREKHCGVAMFLSRIQSLIRRWQTTLCCLIAFVTCFCCAAELPQSAYIWQREWTPAVTNAIRDHGASFAEIVPLKTEIVWEKKGPRAIRIPVDWSTLAATKTEVGLALRIGSFPGPFAKDASSTAFIINELKTMLAEAEQHHVHLADVHIDFDCAESKLAGYEVWVKALRKMFPQLRVLITALPTWLDRAEFASLAHASGGFILQVHSFERPRDFESPFTLCDPKKARLAVERAARLNVPFRVALPTYGYVVAFNSDNKFIGLSAEIPKRWPEGTKTKIVKTSPAEMTALVNEWSKQRPDTMEGVIWYRLPVKGDMMNWSWPTLSAVMQGRIPHASTEINVQHPDPKLTEIHLRNTGDDDLDFTNAISVSWTNAQLVASDALGRFDLIDTAAGKVQFRPRQYLPPLILKPGDECVVGWMRFTQDTEVRCEFLPK